MTDEKTRALIAEAEERLQTGKAPGGRQLYVADDESLIRRLVDVLAAPPTVDEWKLAGIIAAMPTAPLMRVGGDAAQAIVNEIVGRRDEWLRGGGR